MSTTNTSRPWDIKSPVDILAEDSAYRNIIASFPALIQVDSLIRQGKFAAAEQALNGFETDGAERFRNVIFYLRCRIAVESGEHAKAKTDLITFLENNPDDMTALSLLESCICLEWESTSHQVAAGRASNPVELQADDPGMENAEDADLSAYQDIMDDEQVLALALWNTAARRFGSVSRRSELEPLTSRLPVLFPGSLAEACQALTGGEIRKIGFTFQNLTLTYLHLGNEHLGLITPGLGQSLLTMASAESVFLKSTVAGDMRSNPIPPFPLEEKQRI